MSYPVSAYGKLPLSKEYLKHACYEGVAERLREFIDRGYDRFAAQPVRVRDGALRRFVFTGDGASGDGAESAVGWIRNSRDQGKRVFPFVVFARVPWRDLPTGAERVQGLAPLFDSLAAPEARLAELDDRDQFFEEARELQAESLDPHPGGDLGLTIHDWANRLYPEDGEYVWVRALWRAALLKSVLQSGSTAPAALAYRVPIATDLDPLAQVDLWRALLARVFPTGGARQARPIGTVVWSADGEPSCAYLIERSPLTEDFAIFVNGKSPPEDHFTDLLDLSGRLPTDGFSGFKERVEAMMFRSNATCQDLRELDPFV